MNQSGKTSQSLHINYPRNLLAQGKKKKLKSLHTKSEPGKRIIACIWRTKYFNDY